jgi:hypothetical protein
MIDTRSTLAFFDNTDPGAAGWLVLAAWFVLFVLVLNTVVFFLRRLFRRWRGRVGQAPRPTDTKGRT